MSPPSTRSPPFKYARICVIFGVFAVIWWIIGIRYSLMASSNDITEYAPPQRVESPHIQLPEELAADMPIDLNLGTPKHILEHPELHIVPSQKSDYPFLLVSDKNTFPYADGDKAQQKILRKIKLAEQCESDKTIVVDIGAYNGDFGLSAAAMGCHVYVFEPIPFRYWLITNSVAINKFQNQVQVFNMAISPQTTTLKFPLEQGGQTVQITEEQAQYHDSFFEVNATSLDNLLPTEHIHVLKVDVEGFEPTVIFEACKRILEEHRVDYLITEYTVFWKTDGRGPWYNFLKDLQSISQPNGKIFALDRTREFVYGPLNPDQFQHFGTVHEAKRLQTDLLVDFTGTYVADLPWKSTSAA